MASIDDIRKANPSVYGKLTDFEIVDRLSTLTGRAPDAIGYDLGVAPRNAPGFTTAFKGELGRLVQGVGQIGADIVPGVSPDNPLERYGRQVMQRNPNTVMQGESDSALTNITTNLMEQPLNTVGQIGGSMLGLVVPGAALKYGTAALRGLRGAQALGAATTGQRVAQGAATAGYFGIPSYGQMRDEQEAQGMNAPSDKLRAGLSALGIGAIESFAGPEAMLARGVGSVGRAGRNFAVTGAKQGGFEAAEEIIQAPLEAYGAGRDPFTREVLDQALAGGVAGFVGGSIPGAVMHRTMKRLERGEEVDLTGTPRFEGSTQEAALDAANQYRLPDYMAMQARQANMSLQEWIDRQTGIINEQGSKPLKDVIAAFKEKLEVPQVVLDATGTPYTTDSAADFYEFQRFGRTNKNASKAKTTKAAEPQTAQEITFDSATSRPQLRQFLDTQLQNGIIDEEQHIEATNLIDTAKSKTLAKVKDSIAPVLARSTTPVQQNVNQPVGANEVNLTETATTETVAPTGISRDATPEQVAQFRTQTAQQLTEAITPTQMQAIMATRGVRNDEDSGWMIDPDTGEEMVPMSNAVMAKITGKSRQSVDKNAKAGLKKLYKRAADLGLSEEAADRILGIQGEPIADVSSISRAQAAQAGLTFRAPEGQNTVVLPESFDLDTTAENFVPETTITEDVGFTAPEAVAEEQGVELEQPVVEEPVPEETEGYEQDFDLSADDIENAKDVWEMLSESFTAEGVEVPRWNDISMAAFEKFAAEVRFELNRKGGPESVANIKKAQEKAIYGQPTAQGTIESTVTGGAEQAQGTNVKPRKKSTAGGEKPTTRTTKIKRSEAQEPVVGSSANELRDKYRKLFLSPSKFDSLVTVVQSVGELPIKVMRGARITMDNTSVQGFALDNKVYIIADNIEPGKETAVLMHELGVHVGMRNMLTDGQITDLARQITQWNLRSDNSIETRVAKRAMTRVKLANESQIEELGEGMPESIYSEEVIAYFVEEAVEAGIDPLAIKVAKTNSIQQWLKTFVDAFKRAFQKIVGGRFDKLDAQDLVDFAYGAANMELTKPTQAAPATAPLRFSERKSYTEELAESLPPAIRDKVLYANDVTENMAKKGLLYSMFTNDLVDYAEKFMPSVRAWYNRINAKTVEQIKREAIVDEIANASDQLSRQQFERTWNLIKDMTGYKKWAYQPTWRGTVEVDEDYATRFNALSKEERDVIDRVFKHGYETIKETQATLDKILDDEFKEKLASIKTQAEKDKLLAQEKRYKELFRRKLTELDGPYAPMRRVGSHVVVAKSQAYLDAVDKNDTQLIDRLRSDEKHYVVLFTDSRAEAKAERRRLESKNRYTEVKDDEKDLYTNSQEVLPFEAFDKIRQMISEKEGAVAQKLNNLVTELYLTSLAETSARKAELRRDNVAGLNSDTMYKAFISKGRAHAHYISTLKNGKDVGDAFALMRNEARKNGQMSLFNEFAKRYAISTAYDPAPVANKIMAFNTIWSLLTKPAYYVYNATQPVLMTLPYLTQRFAYGKASNVMTQAYKDIAKVKNFVSIKDASLHIESMPADVRRALRDLLDAGKLDITINQDLGSRLTAGQGEISRGMAKVDKFLRTAAQKIETTNRLVTAISAYRLAMTEPNMSHEKAVQYAAKTIDQTQGDYSNFNAPRLFNQTSFQRIVTQFRKFQLIQISYLVRMLKDATVGASVQDKTAARKALGFVLAHHAVLAGALGLPAANVIALIFSASGDDDEPRDLELTLRNALGNGFAADLILRGAPAALLNINISSNVGMGQAFSLLPFTEVDLTREGYNAAVVGSMGPFIGGVLPQMWDAMGAFGRGDYYKGVEGLMPAGVRSALRAVREGAEGATNTRGDELVSPEEITLAETMAKILGFRTNTDATRQLIRSRTYEFEQFFRDRTSRLKNDYANAYENGDSDAMQKARDNWNEMTEFKRQYGFSVQPISNLLKAPMEKRKRETETIGGVQVTKSNRRFVESLIEEEEE